MKRISILGSTGSVGVQVLEVVKDLNDIKIVGLTANKNIELLCEQIKIFKPLKVAVMDAQCYEILCQNIKKLNLDYKIEILQGIDGIVEVAVLEKADMVLNSLIGSIGLLPTIAAIRNKKHIVLANKETLVTAGEIVMQEALNNNVTIYPVDSEHSAIYQCLRGNENNIVSQIYLTASGGPFRKKDKYFIQNITVEDALNHPNWVMGKKITIDSATMMNKGLEVIEAKWLFDIDVKKIKVLVHPQSIIHSMVEFQDGSIIAQLGEPDMKLPIQYALTYPKRLKNSYSKIDFAKRNTLTFEQPDFDKFPCLRLAYDAITVGGTLPAVLNGANEVAVSKFLEEKIKFVDIPKVIEKAMKAYTVKYELDLDTILEADKWSRDFVDNVT